MPRLKVPPPLPPSRRPFDSRAFSFGSFSRRYPLPWFPLSGILLSPAPPIAVFSCAGLLFSPPLVLPDRFPSRARDHCWFSSFFIPRARVLPFLFSFHNERFSSLFLRNGISGPPSLDARSAGCGACFFFLQENWVLSPLKAKLMPAEFSQQVAQVFFSYAVEVWCFIFFGDRAIAFFEE